MLAAVAALPPSTAVAHRGPSIRQQIDATTQRPVVQVWIDTAHADPDSDLAGRVAGATAITAAGHHCTAASTRIRQDGPMTVVTLVFDCPAVPDMAMLDAPKALGAGVVQYIEIVTAKGRMGAFRGPSATLRLGAGPAQRRIVPILVLLASVGAAFLLALGRRIPRRKPT